jgi:hypothetical protein
VYAGSIPTLASIRFCPLQASPAAVTASHQGATLPFMRVFRLMLACLLGLGLVVQGHAGARVMDASCAMNQHMPSAVTEEQGDAGGHLGHADHHAGSQSHALYQGEQCVAADDLTHCACIAGCQSGNSLPLELAMLSGPTMVFRQAPLVLEPTFRSQAVFRHWRPPART